MARNETPSSWDNYFMQLAKKEAKNSTCLRRQVGTVLVQDNQIIAKGHNGAPKGLKLCQEVGCIREELNVPHGASMEYCRSVCAEQYAVIECALKRVSPKGATLYVTHAPCSLCAKILINAGVKRIVYENEYEDKYSIELLKEANVELEKKD